MDYIQIGFTKKTHGVGGEIKVAIEELYEDLFLEADRVFLEIKGAKMPFFLESVRGGGDLIVHFEDVKNKEAAYLLQSKPIFLPVSEVPAYLSLAQATTEYGFLEGFTMIDATAGKLGVVEEILEMPHQEMALIRYNNREVLIPLNKHFIEKIDKPQQQITVNLPEGLLDL
jgi:16S rRNA processing protein RimM